MSNLPSSPRTSPNAGRQSTLAIVAFLLALVAPVIFLAANIASLVHATGVANALFGLSGEVTLPFAIAAIILGHIALAQRQPGRGFAVTSLILGYGSLAAFVVFILFILATFH